MLLDCSECGNKISHEAKRCPNCGKKDPTSWIFERKRAGCLREIIEAVIFWILFLGGLAVLQKMCPAP